LFGSADNNNGWYTSEPSGSDTLYSRRAAIISDSDSAAITIAQWSDPVEAESSSLNEAIINYYARTTTNSAPSLPDTETVYTYLTASLTPTENNGWYNIPPSSGGDYLWIIRVAEAVVGSTSTIDSDRWGSAALISKPGPAGEDGVDGDAYLTIVLYQNAQSSPTVPAVSAGYNTDGEAVATGNWTVSPSSPGANEFTWRTNLTLRRANNAGNWSSYSTAWSTPERLTGTAGTNGTSGFSARVDIAYFDDASGTNPSYPSGTLSGSNYTAATRGTKNFQGTNVVNWTQGGTETAVSNTASDYEITQITGDDGSSGLSNRLDFAYANSSDGSTDFSTTYFTDALYIGTDVVSYTAGTTPPTQSTTNTDYEWVRLRGEDGVSPEAPFGVLDYKDLFQGNNIPTNYVYYWSNWTNGGGRYSFINGQDISLVSTGVNNGSSTSSAQFRGTSSVPADSNVNYIFLITPNELGNDYDDVLSSLDINNRIQYNGTTGRVIYQIDSIDTQAIDSSTTAYLFEVTHVSGTAYASSAGDPVPVTFLLNFDAPSPRNANGFIYDFRSSAGSAPTGGSINWSTGVLTPPSGWSNNNPGTPATGESLYVSYWSAVEDYYNGTTTITYTTPVLAVTTVNDVKSINYDGPLTPTESSHGTEGYLLDASEGNAVFNNIFLRDNIISASAIGNSFTNTGTHTILDWDTENQNSYTNNEDSTFYTTYLTYSSNDFVGDTSYSGTFVCRITNNVNDGTNPNNNRWFMGTFAYSLDGGSTWIDSSSNQSTLVTANKVTRVFIETFSFVLPTAYAGHLRFRFRSGPANVNSNNTPDGWDDNVLIETTSFSVTLSKPQTASNPTLSYSP